jgi:NAD(P)-dependent dehydrogenase (short-subunit alcohol dehydrogenase family)
VALIRLLLKHGVLKSGQGGIPRIIIVSSESHRDPEAIRWDELGHYREHTMGKTVALYGYTKLLLTTFARELSRQLNPGTETRCSVFALCPGPVNTNIGREAPWVFKPLMAVIFWLFFRSPRKAAAPVLYFACASEMEGKAWDYFFLMSRKEIDPKAEDPGNGRQLWQKAEQLLIDSGLDPGRSGH